MKTLQTTACALGLALAVTTGLVAQTRGTGRLAGKITDPSGQPIADVRVTAILAGESAIAFESKTNKEGEWAIGGMAGGRWNLDFTKDGFENKSIAIGVSEVGRIPPIEFAMVPVRPVVDPNAEIKDELIRAAGLMQAKQFVEARQLYERLLAKYPEAHQIHPLIARTYAGENQPGKAIEHLRIAMAKDPANVDVQLLLGNLLIEQGAADEGRKILASVDMARVKEPVAIINSGISLLNQGKPDDAKQFFDKIIAQFPQQPDSYYYRGLAHLQLGDVPKAKTDLEKFVSLAPPDSPDLAHARKILAQLK
ncbi:MAG: tetratricopeptide repeat protein [Vicinamibacterales bacterium]